MQNSCYSKTVTPFS